MSALVVVIAGVIALIAGAVGGDRGDRDRKHTRGCGVAVEVEAVRR